MEVKTKMALTKSERLIRLWKGALKSSKVSAGAKAGIRKRLRAMGVKF